MAQAAIANQSEKLCPLTDSCTLKCNSTTCNTYSGSADVGSLVMSCEHPPLRPRSAGDRRCCLCLTWVSSSRPWSRCEVSAALTSLTLPETAETDSARGAELCSHESSPRPTRTEPDKQEHKERPETTTERKRALGQKVFGLFFTVEAPTCRGTLQKTTAE